MENIYLTMFLINGLEQIYGFPADMVLSFS